MLPLTSPYLLHSPLHQEIKKRQWQGWMTKQLELFSWEHEWRRISWSILHLYGSGEETAEEMTIVEEMREEIEVSTLWVNLGTQESISKGNVITHVVKHEKVMRGWPPLMLLYWSRMTRNLWRMFNERRELGEVEGWEVSWLIIVKGWVPASLQCLALPLLMDLLHLPQASRLLVLLRPHHPCWPRRCRATSTAETPSPHTQHAPPSMPSSSSSSSLGGDGSMRVSAWLAPDEQGASIFWRSCVTLRKMVCPLSFVSSLLLSLAIVYVAYSSSQDWTWVLLLSGAYIFS